MNAMVDDKQGQDSGPSKSAKNESPDVGVDVCDRIARNLIELRKQRGLSLLALSVQSGVNYQTLEEIELAHALPSIGVLWKLARLLGVPCDAFVETVAPTEPSSSEGKSATSH
jgi:ribosome-binding protein aMBF1 (putative translation factor)